MVLPDANRVHSAGGDPPPATLTHTLSPSTDKLKSTSAQILGSTNSFSLSFLLLSLMHNHFPWFRLCSPVVKGSHESLKWSSGFYWKWECSEPWIVWQGTLTQIWSETSASLSIWYHRLRLWINTERQGERQREKAVIKESDVWLLRVACELEGNV